MSSSFTVGKHQHPLLRILRALINGYFRSIEVIGIENIPRGQGGLIVAAHPNGMIDPALIISTMPSKVIFGARDGLFKWPVLGGLMRDLGCVPIYRPQDNTHLSMDEQRELNRHSLGALTDEIKAGSFAALFPEGISHDKPFIKQIRTGAARLFWAAYDREKPALVLPVGLHYERKNHFRTRVLIQYHPPIDITTIVDLPAEERLRELVSMIDENLRQTTMSTTSWKHVHLLHRAASIMLCERTKSTPDFKPEYSELILGRRRVWLCYQHLKENDPIELNILIEELDRYHSTMNAFGISDRQLDHDPRIMKRKLFLVLGSQLLLFVFLLPPIILLGYLIQFPPYIFLILLGKSYSSQKKDQATFQLSAGVLIFPLVWMGWSLAAYFGWTRLIPFFPDLPNIPLAASILMSAFCVGSAVLVPLYFRAARDLLRVLLMRWRKQQIRSVLGELRKERHRLFVIFDKLASDIQIMLPGSLDADGRLNHKDLTQTLD